MLNGHPSRLKRFSRNFFEERQAAVAEGVEQGDQNVSLNAGHRIPVAQATAFPRNAVDLPLMPP